MHLHFVVVHPMHSTLYLPKPSAQLLPPYLNPDEKGIKSDEGVGFWMLLLKSVCWVHWHRPADLISRTCRRRRAAQGNGRARGTLLTSLRLEPQWCFGAMWRLQFLDVFGVEVWDRWITKDYLRFLCNTLQLYLNYVGLIYPVHCHMSSPLL